MNLRTPAALLLVACAAAGRAEEFVLNPSSDTVLIGLPFELTGLARIPADAALAAGEKPDTGAFELLAVELGKPSLGDGVKTIPVRVRAAAFGLGEQTLPPLPFSIARPDGFGGRTELEPLRSGSVTLTVRPPQPSLTDKKGDIRPIRGPYSPARWPWLTAAAALLAAAGAAAYAWLRRRRTAPAAAAPPPDPRTPEEIALEELERLPGSGLPVKELYDRLSDILRLYIRRRCAIDALAMTTGDLQRAMIRAATEPQARARTKALLERCDLAKFARFSPQDGEVQDDCKTAKEIVCLLSPERRSAETVQDLAA